MSTYAELIKKLREDLNLSVARLSNITGISQSVIRDMENGKIKINADKAIKLSKVFGVKILANSNR